MTTQYKIYVGEGYRLERDFDSPRVKFDKTVNTRKPTGDPILHWETFYFACCAVISKFYLV